MAPASPFRPLALGRGTEEPTVATVWLLLALQPIANQLKGCLPALSTAEAEAVDEGLWRTGRAVVYEGDPGEARAVCERLRDSGLTTSLNIQ